MIDKEYLNKVKAYPKQIGKADLVRYLEGKRLYRSQAIRAKCYDCNGMGESYECSDTACSLYPFTQFRVRAQFEKRKAPAHGFKRKEQIE